jgi:hypothetical protein
MWLLGVKDSLKHFLFSGFVGFLVYYTTWTIFWFSSPKAYRSRGKICSEKRDDHYINSLCWGLALFASSVCHCIQDGVI